MYHSGGILSNSNLTYNFKIVAKLISWKLKKNYLVKDISGSLLQTAQTWANAGVCSASVRMRLVVCLL